MIKHTKPRLKIACYMGLVGLLSVYSSFALSRTLIFQSSSEASPSASAKPNTFVEPSSQVVSQVEQNTQQLPVANLPSVQTSSGNSELFFMIEQLQSEVNSLRGLLEEQAHELRMLKQSGKDRYLDLDTRILDITKRVSQSVSKPVDSSKTAPLEQVVDPTNKGAKVQPIKKAQIVTKPIEASDEEQQAYDAAFALIQDKKFDESIIALFSYTENHPKSPLIPNVYYWLGEVYLATGKLEQAKTSFSFVIKAFPANSKVPDALYKLAVTLDRLGDKNEAGQYLKDVQENYPNSTAAKLASSYKLSP